METQPPALSGEFQRLYCDSAVFEDFSVRHPVRLTRVLPFQAQDPVMDDSRLLAAEEAHLGQPDAATRLAVVAAWGQCGLLAAEDVTSLKPIVCDFDADFFELMGEVYANARMFICALRWYREQIQVLEALTPGVRSDREDVYAGVGYCLYALGLFAEAIAWTKSCIGPDWMELTVGPVLMDYQAQLLGGRLLATERSTNRTRYTGSTAREAEVTRQSAQQLGAALKQFTPFQESYINWISAHAPALRRPAESYPFKLELDNGCLPRHKMNLLFALCGQADELSAQGFAAEAKRLLQEAALLEPQAEFVWEKLKMLP